MATKYRSVGLMTPSRTVDQRQFVADLVADVVKTHADEMQHTLANRFSWVLDEGESLPDLALFQQLVKRVMVCQMKELAAVDEALRQEREMLTGWRHQRETAIEVLHRWLHGLCALGGTLQSPLLQTLWESLPKRVACQGEALLAQAEQVLAALRAPELQVLGVVQEPEDGVEVDVEQMTADLDALTTRLCAALVAVAAGAERVAAMVACKRGTMAEFDRVHGATLLILHGLFALADQPGLDEYPRLRPRLPRPESSRRRRSLASLFP